MHELSFELQVFFLLSILWWYGFSVALHKLPLSHNKAEMHTIYSNAMSSCPEPSVAEASEALRDYT